MTARAKLSRHERTLVEILSRTWQPVDDLTGAVLGQRNHRRHQDLRNIISGLRRRGIPIEEEYRCGPEGLFEIKELLNAQRRFEKDR